MDNGINEATDNLNREAKNLDDSYVWENSLAFTVFLIFARKGLSYSS